jgi:hypothetical protein
MQLSFQAGTVSRFLALPELLERRLAAASEFVTIEALSPFLRLASWRKRKMYFECVITFPPPWVETEHLIDSCTGLTAERFYGRREALACVRPEAGNHRRGGEENPDAS